MTKANTSKSMGLKSAPAEVARILAAWGDLGVKDLDRQRARGGFEPVGEHLAKLRYWESEWRSRDAKELAA